MDFPGQRASTSRIRPSPSPTTWTLSVHFIFLMGWKMHVIIVKHKMQHGFCCTQTGSRSPAVWCWEGAGPRVASPRAPPWSRRHLNQRSFERVTLASMTLFRFPSTVSVTDSACTLSKINCCFFWTAHYRVRQKYSYVALRSQDAWSRNLWIELFRNPVPG